MPNKKWTREDIIESARRFNTRGEWKKGDRKAYDNCWYRNWLNDPDITGHMVAVYEDWDKPKMAKSARRFRTRKEWKKGDDKAYQACHFRGWLNDPDITGHMQCGREKWKKPELIESARQFSTRGEWAKGDSKAYSACCDRGWLNDPDITGHMVAVLESWDKPKLVESARRFRTKNEWKKGDDNAYQACTRYGWLDDPDITGHMVPNDGVSDNDAVYFYEFEYARITLYKIGLTSVRLGDERIKYVMKEAGYQPSNIFIWRVDNAREIERRMLEVGTQQEFYSGHGSTEMRILTPEQVRRVLRIAQNASTGESQYLETI